MENANTLSRKMAVAITMNELVNDIEFKDMRINDICTACGLSRSAFYRLFEDKHEACNSRRARTLQLLMPW